MRFFIFWLHKNTGLWIGLATILLGYSTLTLALSYGYRFVSGDEWAYVEFLVGERNASFNWLLMLHGEHFIPFVKLWMLAISKHFEYSSPFNVCCLFATSVIILIEVRKRRGAWAISDSFVPLLLLNPAHFMNQGLTTMGIKHITSGCLACLLVTFVSAQDPWKNRQRTWGILLLLLFLPFTTAAGLVLSLSMLPWLVVAAIQLVKFQTPRQPKVSVALLLCVGCIGLIFLYYLKRFFPQAPLAESSVLVFTWRFLRTSFGALLLDHGKLVSVVLIATIASIAICGARLLKTPENRPHLLAISLALLSVVLQGALAGQVRQISFGYSLHYGIRTALVPLTAYILTINAGRAARAFGYCLVIVMTWSFILGWGIVNRNESIRKATYALFERAAQNGASPSTLARDYGDILHGFLPQQQLEAHLALIKKHSLGPFRSR